MKITAIKQQVKRQGRYSIFVEGKYAFSLSDTALLETGLTNGQELSASEVKVLKQQSVDDKLYNNALNYVALRPRSTWEMQQYLQRKGCSPSLAEGILNKLSYLDLLNDEVFARSWVANRRLLKPISRRRLNQELRAKRIPEEIIQSVLGKDETDELDVLRELVERKRRQSRYHDVQKLMQYLASQGFQYSDIKTVLSETD